MAKDILNVESNERVDLGDFQEITKQGLDQAAHVVESFNTNPSGQQAWILSGFAISNPSGKQITVTKGRAILARRDGAQIFQGLVTTAGDTSKTIDVTTFAAGTYGIFVRFDFIDGDDGSRIFWNSAGAGFEFAQTFSTHRKANWSLRIELLSPGIEWLQIGTVDQASVAIVDQRPFYFEGTVNSTYASGWGGGTNDRNDNRALYGISDLQLFAAAMRQCIEEIKGVRWWKTVGVALNAMTPLATFGVEHNTTTGHHTAITGNTISLGSGAFTANSSGNVTAAGFISATGNITSGALITGARFTAGEGAPGTGGYGFTESGMDTGMFSTGDGDIGWYVNGTRRAELKNANGLGLRVRSIIPILSSILTPGSQLDLVTRHANNCVLAFGLYSGGSILWGYNLASASIASAGIIDITLSQAVDTGRSVPIAVTSAGNFTCNPSWSGATLRTFVQVASTGTLTTPANLWILVIGAPSILPTQDL